MSRPSLRDAIDAQCKGCIYDPISPGTWREQVGCCSSSNCPLHSVRPLPINFKSRGDSDEAEAPEPSSQAGVMADGQRFGLNGSIPEHRQ